MAYFLKIYSFSKLELEKYRIKPDELYIPSYTVEKAEAKGRGQGPRPFPQLRM